MIRIHAFGPPLVRKGELPLTGAAAQPRRVALLAILARVGDRGITRDKLLMYLWPDATEERARRNLTQAVYALRRDLGADDAIVGGRDLRLNESCVSTDIGEFTRAFTAGRFADAVALYSGAFLDGFHIDASPEFEEWVARERAVLARQFADALERLATEAAERAAPVEAVQWWRRRVLEDPLDARLVMSLMRALALAGDRQGALNEAATYANQARTSVLPADPAVSALAKDLRDQVMPEGAATQFSVNATSDIRPPAQVPESGTPASPRLVPSPRAPVRFGGWKWVAGFAAVAAVAVAMAWPRGRAGTPIIAVGYISDAAGGDSGSSGRALVDLLGTSLARSPSLRVVSSARIWELTRQLGDGRTDDPGVIVAAARLAGAQQILTGTMYRPDRDRLALELQRVDLRDGAVVDVWRLEGSNLFALADSGTRRVLDRLGLRAPGGSIADVTARSEAAALLYQQGLQEWLQGHPRPAEQLFLASLQEDSMFAMAQYYAAITSSASPDETFRRWNRATALAAHTSDRERRLILARYPWTLPSVAYALADTLVRQYPDEVDGYFLLGLAKFYAGENEGAVASLNRAVAMDSLAVKANSGRCTACDAMLMLVLTWWTMDSLDRAEAVDRQWLHWQPASAWAQTHLVRLLYERGKFASAESVTASARGRFSEAVFQQSRYRGLLLAGRFDELEALVANPVRPDSFWLMASRRSQGQWNEALALQRTFRVTLATVQGRWEALLYGVMLGEAGRVSEAVAVLDSVVDQERRNARDHAGRAISAALLVLSDLVAEQGDTLRLARLADSLALVSARGDARQQRLQYHARGLMERARGLNEAAIANLQRALVSPTMGYPRTVVRLSEALQRVGRPQDAVPLLQAALRGDFDANGALVTRTELHARLADAWTAAGRPDSAAEHLERARQAWSHAEPVRSGPLLRWLGAGVIDSLRAPERNRAPR